MILFLDFDGVTGNPQVCAWRYTTAELSTSGRDSLFNASKRIHDEFVAEIGTLDNKVKTTTDEVGPYETDVQFPSNDKAVWTSPHQNVITVLVIDGGVKGAGRLGDLTLQYSSKR